MRNTSLVSMAAAAAALITVALLLSSATPYGPTEGFTQSFAACFEHVAPAVFMSEPTCTTPESPSSGTSSWAHPLIHRGPVLFEFAPPPNTRITSMTLTDASGTPIPSVSVRSCADVLVPQQQVQATSVQDCIERAKAATPRPLKYAVYEGGTCTMGNAKNQTALDARPGCKPLVRRVPDARGAFDVNVWTSA